MNCLDAWQSIFLGIGFVATFAAFPIWMYVRELQHEVRDLKAGR